MTQNTKHIGEPCVITAESVAAAQVVLDNMTPAERAELQERLRARWDREETRRQDFALHLQIKASPRQWL